MVLNKEFIVKIKEFLLQNLNIILTLDENIGDVETIFITVGSLVLAALLIKSTIPNVTILRTCCVPSAQRQKLMYFRPAKVTVIGSTIIFWWSFFNYSFGFGILLYGIKNLRFISGEIAYALNPKSPNSVPVFDGTSYNYIQRGKIKRNLLVHREDAAVFLDYDTVVNKVKTNN